MNGEPAPSTAQLTPTHQVFDDGLEVTSLALDFKVKPKHFRKGDLKLKVSGMFEFEGYFNLLLN